MSDDRFDKRRYHNEDTFRIQSTAGAIPVRNKKGEVSMQKVKVQRYVSGKRPDYAKGNEGAEYDSESESDDGEDFTSHRRQRRRHDPEYGGEVDGDDEEMADDEEPSFDRERHDVKEESDIKMEVPETDDPRLKRLRAARESAVSRNEVENASDEEEDRLARHRRIHEPEILSDGEDDDAMESDESSEEDEEQDEDAVQRKRDLIRQRALARAQIGVGQEEVMAKEDEKPASEDDDGEETTEEETSDEEDEEDARPKPVFVRKRDRLTVQEREREEAKQRQAEREAAQLAEQRRRYTLRMVEDSVRREANERAAKDGGPAGLSSVVTDDENEELEYEAWKLRELKRLKRERDEKEERAREAAEVERTRNMTEEERRMDLKLNPKQVTNRAAKGKYKFLQKYYHRGAFFLDKEENVYKRDISDATLEDKFDKTVLPKVMQVKNFGRSGRTKYTHLVDQDTTQFDAAWSQETTQNLKFQLNHAAGIKPVFERPSAKKKK